MNQSQITHWRTVALLYLDSRLVKSCPNSAPCKSDTSKSHLTCIAVFSMVTWRTITMILICTVIRNTLRTILTRETWASCLWAKTWLSVCTYTLLSQKFKNEKRMFLCKMSMHAGDRWFLRGLVLSQLTRKIALSQWSMVSKPLLWILHASFNMNNSLIFYRCPFKHYPCF